MPIDIDNVVAERFAHEVMLGNHLYLHPWVIDYSDRMANACLRYLRVRSACSGGSLADALTQVASPIDLPFAGRVQSAGALYKVLRGGCAVREQQCAIWRVFAQLIAPDLVGANRRFDALDIAHRAGFDVNFLHDWLADATRYASLRLGETVALEQLDARFDFLRMDWHAIRQLQNETRVVHSAIHQRQRYWSLRSRAAHRALGGTFSEVESMLYSPLGKEYLPWMDTRRFLKPNPDHAWVREAAQSAIPLITGASGVGMHTHQFAKALGIHDVVSTRLVAIAYLLPMLQHSIYEVVVSERTHAPLNVDAYGLQEWVPIEFPSLDSGILLADQQRFTGIRSC
ncbi:hypothetical protein [Pseudomonas putida]